MLTRGAVNGSPVWKLVQQGQSLWLDSISRTMLGGGSLHRHIDQRSVTGLTSNPTVFHTAIAGGV